MSHAPQTRRHDTAPGPQDLLAFLDASPSPFHAVEEVARRLGAAGFVELVEDQPWPDTAGDRFVRRGGSLVAWRRAPEAVPGAGFRIVGAHTDSPNLRIKPQPDTGAADYRQLGVEVYGGVLLNSWLDRDLGLSGRIALRGGTTRLLRVDRPVLRVPQLAIHLDRDVVDKGLVLNRQTHMTPVWDLGPVDEGGFVRFVGAELDVDPADVVAWDVMVHDVTPAALVGLGGAMVSSGRIDNLVSCHAATTALLAAAPDDRTVPLICLFDHEEVGSVSARGAASSMLPTVIQRIVPDATVTPVALARSLCVSADGAHATHPNYADRHESDHHIALDGGPVVKVNVNQRYATDAVSHAAFIEACEQADVPYQRFVNRSDLPCGSTIGPVTAARLGIPTVDAGVAQLAMHSARELCGARDPQRLSAALAAFAAGSGAPVAAG